jgi:glutamine synthetase
MSLTIIAEYIWLGGEGELRGKTKIFNTTLDKFQNFLNISDYPDWNFDGSSTDQAKGTHSETILKPRAVYKNPLSPESSKNHRRVYTVVLCDTYDKDGKPLKTNTRFNAAKIFDTDKAKEQKPWFGIEQEYFLFPISLSTQRRYRNEDGSSVKQGDYYCAVGTTRSFDRNIVEEHMVACLDAELKIGGVNAEVAPGQWEYQIGPCEGIEAGDQLWMSRWLMERITEKYNVEVCWHPKPLEFFNGSGCHTNYSTVNMRETNSNTDANKSGINYIFDGIRKLAGKHTEHMEIYGIDNDKRMCGEYEAANFQNFTFDINKPVDRGASIRIGYETLENKEGYFEDRRPASNMDPYLVTAKIFETISADDIESIPIEI